MRIHNKWCCASAMHVSKILTRNRIIYIFKNLMDGLPRDAVALSS